MSRAARVPGAAQRYFTNTLGTDDYDHPVIVQQFDHKWTQYPFRKRISGAWARKMRAEGVTHVQLETGGRFADFRIEELTKRN